MRAAERSVWNRVESGAGWSLEQGGVGRAATDRCRVHRCNEVGLPLGAGPKRRRRCALPRALQRAIAFSDALTWNPPQLQVRTTPSFFVSLSKIQQRRIGFERRRTQSCSRHAREHEPNSKGKPGDPGATPSRAKACRTLDSMMYEWFSLQTSNLCVMSIVLSRAGWHAGSLRLDWLVAGRTPCPQIGCAGFERT